MLTIKQHGSWKSSNVAEGYIERSIEKKKTIANQIFGNKEISPRKSNSEENYVVNISATSNQCSSNFQGSTSSTLSADQSYQFSNIFHCSTSNNCNINIYNK